MSHAGHGRKICQYGGYHGGCRCPSDTILRVTCDTEEEHRDVPAEAGYVPPGSVDDETAGALTLEQALEGVKVSFWQCLVPDHRKREGQTVLWMNGVAHCTAPGCDLTSELTREYAELVREVVLEDKKGIKLDIEPRPTKLWAHDLKGRVLRLANKMIVVPVEFRGQSWSCVVIWCPPDLENSYPRGGYDIIVFNGELTEADEIEVGS